MADEGVEIAKPRRRGRVFVALGSVAVFLLGGVTTVLLQRYVPALLPPLDNAFGYQPLAVAKVAWPRLNTCDENTVVAMQEGLLASPAAISQPMGQDPRDGVISAGGGSYLDGKLTVALATRDASTAQIVGLRVKIFKTFDSRVSWVLNAGGGGCGGVDIRLFEARLDEGGRVIDRGVQVAQEVPSKSSKGQPLGTGFTVSGADQAQIVVEVMSCHHSYAWGLEIDYLVAGEKYTYPLGTSEEPLISLGRRDGTTKLYADSDPVDDAPPAPIPFTAPGPPGESQCKPGTS